MSDASIEEALKITLEDHRLSRGEKRALAKVVEKIDGDEHRLGVARSYAFKLVRESMADSESHVQLLDWLENAIKVLLPPSDESQTETRSEAYFSPEDGCVSRIVRLFTAARTAVDVCVYTITDDRISDAIVAAHRRGVSIRIISDNDKAEDLGSDVRRLDRQGIPVRIDRSEYHMHHKYAIFDKRHLLTGSYNWTRSAAEHNEENFIVINDAALLNTFRSEFEKLWKQLG